MGGWADGSVDQGAEGSEDSRWLVKPLHPQVRIVDAGYRRTLYVVELHDGDVWEYTHSSPLPRERAEARARWLSDVLEHARDVALEEAAAEVERRSMGGRPWVGAAADIRDLKGVRDA